MGKNSEFYKICISYNNVFSRKGTNGKLFRIGDSITVTGMTSDSRSSSPYSNGNGVYRIVDIEIGRAHV